MRYFELVRDEDVSGVSGEGVVADGVVTETGHAIMRWHNEDNPRLDTDADGLSIKPGPDGAEATEEIHGHSGRTHIEWRDDADEGDVRSAAHKLLAGLAETKAALADEL